MSYRNMDLVGRDRALGKRWRATHHRENTVRSIGCIQKCRAADEFRRARIDVDDAVDVAVRVVVAKRAVLNGWRT